MKYKTPICEKCGRVMKGRIPADTPPITCFFCTHLPFDDSETDNTSLKYKDVK